jgi:precorrin-6A/cobalt-precorrin-6A reductase
MKSLWFLVRLIDQPKSILPLENFQVITGQPPYILEDEQSILVQNSIDTLVAKHAGGSATEAKIFAAADTGVKIVLIRRPEPEKGHVAESVDKALAWIQERI